MTRLLSDDFIKGLAETIASEKELYPDNFARFAKQMRYAASNYKVTRREATRNQIRKEIKKLNSLASLALKPPPILDKLPFSAQARRHRIRIERQYIAVQEHIAEMSPEALSMLRARFAQRDPAVGKMLDPATLLPSHQSAPDEARYCWEIASLTQLGRGFKLADDGNTPAQGRKRPGGGRSRPAPDVLLYAPVPEENREWRAAERQLEMFLAIAWLELIGAPPSDVESYRVFVQSAFEELGVPDVDVPALVRAARRR